MGFEIFEALRALEKERGIPLDYMLEKINKAIVIACKNSYGGNDEVIVNIDEEEGVFAASLVKTIVEENVEDPNREIALKDAKKIEKKAKVGETIGVPIETKEFGRIAAQTARNIIRQGIKDGEREQIMQEFQDKIDQIVSALIERIDPQTGAMTLRIGKAETTLPKTEQIGTEKLREGGHIKVYVSDVRPGDKGPRIMISRTHSNFVKKLFENEVPEITDGIVEIMAVSREAGSRSKVAIKSNNPDVDAIGSCIGAQGNRINIIINELGGEKIDLIEYSNEPDKFIAAALAPTKVIRVDFDPELENACQVIVPDNQLSLAIGAKGQNVRLAARLTGYKIDIKPESGFFGGN